MMAEISKVMKEAGKLSAAAQTHFELTTTVVFSGSSDEEG